MEEHAREIERSFRDSTREEFESRLEDQVKVLKNIVQNKEIENNDFTVGLELETYAVDDEGNIKPIPDEKIEDAPFNPELGLQNAELNTEPATFSPEGIERQEENLENKFSNAQNFLQQDNMRLILDSIWTLSGFDSRNYLTEVEEVENRSFAVNMREATRYYILDNGILEKFDEGLQLDLPGVNHIFPSILFECLATSVQPHLQVPDIERFPDFYNLASRTIAPILALTSNSPFLPPELYNQVDEPQKLVDETFHELRIPIFEKSVNPGDKYSEKKVRYPEDINSVEEIIEKVAEDDYYDPYLKEWKDEEEKEFTDRFWEWNYKRKTFWRWSRPVIGGRKVGDACNEKNIRIEYRPVPTQPTIRDNISVLTVVNGLIIGLEAEDHPLQKLNWDESKENFYRAVENGINADLKWINSEGDKITDKNQIMDEIFYYARKGLEKRGFEEEEIDKYVEPLQERWMRRKTPSNWKKNRVRDKLDLGKTLEKAIKEMQKEYIEKSGEKPFYKW